MSGKEILRKVRTVLADVRLLTSTESKSFLSTGRRMAAVLVFCEVTTIPMLSFCRSPRPRTKAKGWSMSSIKRDVKKKVLPRPESRGFLEIQPTIIRLPWGSVTCSHSNGHPFGE